MHVTRNHNPSLYSELYTSSVHISFRNKQETISFTEYAMNAFILFLFVSALKKLFMYVIVTYK